MKYVSNQPDSQLRREVNGAQLHHIRIGQRGCSHIGSQITQLPAFMLRQHQSQRCRIDKEVRVEYSRAVLPILGIETRSQGSLNVERGLIGWGYSNIRDIEGADSRN